MLLGNITATHNGERVLVLRVDAVKALVLIAAAVYVLWLLERVKQALTREGIDAVGRAFPIGPATAIEKPAARRRASTKKPVAS